MFEQLRNGFLGMFLVIGQWLSPGGERPDIEVTSVKRAAGAYVVQCAMTMGWNDELEAMVDAGIPLRVKFGLYCEGGDSTVFVRTLRCDVADLTYAFSDSGAAGDRDARYASGTYPQVLLALRDFSRWTCTVPAGGRTCRIAAELLPSVATRLNRTVDMSGIWGQRSISRVVVLESGGSSGQRSEVRGQRGRGKKRDP